MKKELAKKYKGRDRMSDTEMGFHNMMKYLRRVMQLK